MLKHFFQSLPFSKQTHPQPGSHHSPATQSNIGAQIPQALARTPMPHYANAGFEDGKYSKLF